MGDGNMGSKRWYPDTNEHTFTQQQIKRADDLLAELNQQKARCAYLETQNEKLAMKVARAATLLTKYGHKLEQAQRVLDTLGDIFSFQIPTIETPEQEPDNESESYF